ncbi:MAG TPA: amino acid adenylation domain-containing protein [Bacteroidales bacterium]|nr:amino acid adenylation domain-containing protein [Bacteroidales bacterium]HPS17647.1 amino acid adenylation domain-containing protein [Bacteroidales bacterium]
MKINIIEYFIDTVNVANNKIAVIDGDRNVSFSELNAKAKIIAYEIIRLNNCINKPIAVFLPKSIESVVADIAIIYSGNCYMNLDVKYPQARLKNIIEQVRPQFIITSSAYSSALEALGSHVPVINMDLINVDINFNEEKLRSNVKRIIDTDPLCIINTSGSTGTPKGVVLNHRSFFDFTEWAVETLGITDHEIVGSLSPSIFDIYSFELCMLMAKGSTLVLIPEQNSAFPATILDIMQKNEVSFIFWVPTIMVNIANMDLLSKIALPKLKTVWFAGEVFPTKQFNYWKKNLQGTKFVNLYGPIEITLDCTYYIVERDLKDEEPIPIGFPCRNTDILVLKENDQPAGINEEGELCVRGTSLAMGYYNNREKTEAAFVQNPLNTSYPEIIYRTGDIVFMNERSELIFKGRKDSLIKHLGYRIELGEIEHVIINTLKLVDNGCVVYNTTKKEITLIYESTQEKSIAEMKRAIAQMFPKYMVPTAYHKMEKLPRNTNGKIDRLKLSSEIC